MAVNKVVYSGQTLVDLTSDTVTADTLAEGVTAHNASGNKITGTMKANTPTPFTNLYDPANVVLKTISNCSSSAGATFTSDNYVNYVKIPFHHIANSEVAIRTRGLSLPVRDRQNFTCFGEDGTTVVTWGQLSSAITMSYDEYGDSVMTFKSGAYKTREWYYLYLNFQYEGINSSAATAYTGPIITINEPIGNGGYTG